MKISRNDPCPCGSGKKYKKCCLNNATESTTLSYAWRKMRITDGELADPLLKHAIHLFTPQGMKDAWEEFHGFPEVIPEVSNQQVVFEQAFIPWFLYNWCPEPDDESTVDLPEVIAAEDYLTQYRSKLDNYEASFIHANLESHYSIYEVIHVVRQQSITLKDVLRGHQIIIHEKRGSESLQKGQIIMTRIITIDNDSIACGMYPQPLPSSYLLTFVEFKQHYAKNKFFTNDMLFSYDLEIRKCFMGCVNHLIQNPFPQLHNTDGDEFHFHKIHYQLICTPQRVFDVLSDLTLSIDKISLSKEGVYDTNQQLIEISFPWLKKGNAAHKDWSNTVYAHILIKDGMLIIEVNSEKRAQSVLLEIDSRLNKEEATYLHTEKKSMKDMMAEPHEKEDNPCDDSPEIQAMLKQLSKKHWTEWLDQKIPALENFTPREAVKTGLGRERLEALFADFHQKNQTIASQCPVDLNYLRQELGMT